MDLINNRTKDITKMALDGLYERSKAISANTVNALTPDYKRKEVNFEDSLREIINNDKEREELKLQNSAFYQKHPDMILKGKSPAELALLSTDLKDTFEINVETDMSDPVDSDGNNVSIEREMMDESKNGMQYMVLTNLLSKQYQQLGAVITGQTGQ